MKAEELVMVTDTHFGHRPPTGSFTLRTPEDDLRMFAGLVKYSGHRRTLVHMGDVVFGLNKDATLNTYLRPLAYDAKILIRGNHDTRGDEFYYQWFDLVVESLVVKVGKRNILITHCPQPWDGKWDLNLHGHFHDNDHRTISSKDGDFSFAVNSPYHQLFAIEHTSLEPRLLGELINAEG